MSSFLITIGIPTWNRCAYLKKNLTALMKQLEQIPEKSIEILVSDNASTDETASICSLFAAQYSFFRYVRHETNRGANANFEYVITCAQGEYVWLLGDDDLLVPDAITQVCDDLCTYKPDLTIGPSLFDHTLQKANLMTLTVPTLTDQRIFSKTNAIEVAGKISGLIFKKSSIEKILDTARPLINKTQNAWPHLFWVLLLLNHPESRLLLLPYGTNYLVMDHWHNCIFTGCDLITIHIADYQTCIHTLQPYLSNRFYQNLLAHSVADRISILIKCVIYATYLDADATIRFHAQSIFSEIIGFKNKWAYSVGVLLPLRAPKSVRRFVIKGLARLSGWRKLNELLSRLEKAEQTLKFHANPRGFSKQQL